VEVPPGALTAPVDIAVGIVSAEEAGVDPTVLAGPIYELTPDGTVFDAPVTTERSVAASDLDVDEDAIPFFAVLQSDGEEWLPLSTDTSRDGATLTIRAETTHFSRNLAVDTTRVLSDHGLILEMRPASFSAPVGTEVETRAALILIDREDLWINQLDRSVSSFTGSLVSYRFESFIRGWVAICGDAPGPGTYTATVGGRLTLEDPDDPELPEDVFLRLVLGAGVVNAAFSMSVTGEATCTAAGAGESDGAAGDEQAASPGEALLAATAGSYGGALTLSDGATDIQSDYLVSFLTPESVEAIGTDEAKALIEDLIRFLQDQRLRQTVAAAGGGPSWDPEQFAQRPVFLSQFFTPDSPGQNTFGGATDFGAGSIIVITANVAPTHSELYNIEFSCSDTQWLSDPTQGSCSQLNVERGVSIGGPPGLDISCALGDAFLLLTGAEPTTCGQDYGFVNEISGEVVQETGQGGA